MNIISIASRGFLGLEAGGGPSFPVFVPGPTITSELVGTAVVATKELKPMIPSIVPLVPPIQRIEKSEEPNISIEDIKPKIEVN